ncbi:methylated-DNA--[protein]-cysteine S-methyltransferase [Corynebacterium pacaense]|uniref:methylated-DNA--[protein]-cysteine S-methyltransferase n=1 Tax=Corynebacterium pacaense TaxID=1816684 RepID=UPI0009B97C18|nr:methylated-DNA--[protein]-cysteine S-methyltransferase [Corynebacterium pacaense]
MKITTLATPDGDFTIIVSCGAVLASGWTTDIASLLALIHPILRPDTGEMHRTGPGDAEVAAATDAVGAYYRGELDAPARIPVHQESGEFRTHAWDVLRGVGPGDTVSYRELAELSDRPAAIRAAAGACAMNAAALFVPCHRVLRSDGGLGGFRYGTEIKRSLLARESRQVQAPSIPGL